MSNPPKDEVVDFSGYYNKTETQVNNASAINLISDIPKKPMRTTYWLIGILVFLAIAQVVIIIATREKPAQIPEGYRMTDPAKGPPRLEKIK